MRDDAFRTSIASQPPPFRPWVRVALVGAFMSTRAMALSVVVLPLGYLALYSI